MNLRIGCEFVVYTFLKFLKNIFLHTAYTQEKYMHFRLFNHLFHISTDRYSLQLRSKNLKLPPSSVEKCSPPPFNSLLTASSPKKLSIKILGQINFKKSVDILWNFLCIPVDYFKNPQIWGSYPLLHSQFIHMIKVIDSNCLGVL